MKQPQLHNTALKLGPRRIYARHLYTTCFAFRMSARCRGKVEGTLPGVQMHKDTPYTANSELRNRNHHSTRACRSQPLPYHPRPAHHRQTSNSQLLLAVHIIINVKNNKIAINQSLSDQLGMSKASMARESYNLPDKQQRF